MRYQMWDEQIFTVLIIIEKISMKHEVQWILSAEDFLKIAFKHSESRKVISESKLLAKTMFHSYNYFLILTFVKLA